MEKIKNYSFNFVSMKENEKNNVSKLWFYVFFILRSGGDHRRAMCYFLKVDFVEPRNPQSNVLFENTLLSGG